MREPFGFYPLIEELLVCMKASVVHTPQPLVHLVGLSSPLGNSRPHCGPGMRVQFLLYRMPKIHVQYQGETCCQTPHRGQALTLLLIFEHGLWASGCEFFQPGF